MNILYYDGGNTEKRNKVDAVLQAFPMAYTMVDEQDGNQTIAALFELEKKTTAIEDMKLPQIDLMIFHEVEDELINAISKELKTKDCHVERDRKSVV